jgi:intein/homing endonuclease
MWRLSKWRKKIDLSKVEFSRNDLKLGIKVPEYLTEDLAYFLGFHVGDGCMLIQKRPGKVDYRLQYDGHKINKHLFYKNSFKPLIKKIFNKEVNVTKTTKGTVRVAFRSKAILTFLKTCCDIPLGPKVEAVVPSIVQRSEKIIKAKFLQGLADTDFSLSFKKDGKYPVINHGTYSKSLHESVKVLLNELSVTYYAATYYRNRKGKRLTVHHIDINGRKRLKQWMDLIGNSSYNTLSRYLVWKETGTLPPGTNIHDRIRILKNMGIKFPKKAPPARFELATFAEQNASR